LYEQRCSASLPGAIVGTGIAAPWIRAKHSDCGTVGVSFRVRNRGGRTELLDRVGQFMGQQQVPDSCAGLVFARTKGDILSDGKRAGLIGTSDRSGPAVRMNSNSAETGSEAAFHSGTH
jgi:hypothetical protein